ncbi:helix-turn-helix transcriptional regulator [Halopseudomonas oceani]|uniref:S24 family peptidase n=1 Tax=Halopseudomonas oceani TaxID=1708783 RepID=UPI002AA77089|nr:helix-turn-helix transcriptional regulator [Halopseudomonas oceani]
MHTQSIRRANLAALIETKFGGVQSALAQAIERSPSYVNRCLLPEDHHNYKPIGEKFARHVEKMLGMLPGALDAPPGSDNPERRSLLRRAGEPYADSRLAPVETWSDDTPLGEDEVELPFYKEVEMSAGKGSEVRIEDHGRKLRFGKRTLSRKNIIPECAACATVTGNSMEPVLPDGTTVGINTSITGIKDGQMYAIDHDGQLRVKVLYRRPGNGIRLHSYNDAEHPDEVYEADYVDEKIRIIGQVFWYSVLL